MKKIMITLAASAILATSNAAKIQDTKSLVVYYSQTGVTETVAKLIQEKTHADIEAIIAENPYDGDFNATIQRSMKEREAGIECKIKPLHKDIAKYDTIYIGYPIWYGTYAPPVATFVKNINAEGKVIIPFCTFGSGGLETSIADLKKNLKNTTILDGYGIRTARIDKASAEIDFFFETLNGTAPKRPEFSEQKPVKQEEKAIFQQACGDYPMPLGSPITVGSRSFGNTIEYKFTAKSTSPDGKETFSTIYVIKEENELPEFTKVVR
jgi:flavodoxin